VKKKSQFEAKLTTPIFCKNDELIQLNDWVNEQSCVTPKARNIELHFQTKSPKQTTTNNKANHQTATRANH